VESNLNPTISLRPLFFLLCLSSSLSFISLHCVHRQLDSEMDYNVNIVTATPASVLDLLNRVERHWPVREDTRSPSSPYQLWRAKAHEAVSYGLMTLSSSFWTYPDPREEAKERRFPADEFNEFKESLVQSLYPRVHDEVVKMVSPLSIPVTLEKLIRSRMSFFGQPWIEHLSMTRCDLIIDMLTRQQAPPELNTPCATVNVSENGDPAQRIFAELIYLDT